MLKSWQRWLAPLPRKLIFYPAPPSHLAYARLQSRALSFQVDNLSLQGWQLENATVPGNSALLYFGGNAEDVVHSLDFLARLPVRHVFAFNYRGYGLSQGSPSEAALFADALALHRQLQQRFDLADHSFHVAGRSLGSAVATHLAAHRPMASVTLITPLQSIAAIGAELFPWLPVSRLLADRFDLLDNARVIGAPLLAVLAGRDEVIPNRHSLQLIKAWKGPKQQLLIAQADHNSVTAYPECPAAITAFLQAQTPPRPAAD